MDADFVMKVWAAIHKERDARSRLDYAMRLSTAGLTMSGWRMRDHAIRDSLEKWMASNAALEELLPLPPPPEQDQKQVDDAG